MKKKKRQKKVDLSKGVALFVLMTLILSTAFLIVAIIVAPSGSKPDIPHNRVKSDYTLMLIQCILGIFAMMLPSIAQKRFSLKAPSIMLVFYAIFLYCAIFLGEVRNFYYNIPHWDTILHTFSGAMLAAFGFSVVSFMNKTERIPINLSHVFVAFFAFCFAVTMGVMWEIYEFTFDKVLGLNMQKFALEDGTLLIGRAALTDTMKDLIVDSIGALIISFIGYISLKYKKGWIEKVYLSMK